MERKIVLVNDACFRAPITIKFQDLHAHDIKRAMGEVTSYYKRD